MVPSGPAMIITKFRWGPAQGFKSVHKGELRLSLNENIPENQKGSDLVRIWRRLPFISIGLAQGDEVLSKKVCKVF